MASQLSGVQTEHLGDRICTSQEGVREKEAAKGRARDGQGNSPHSKQTRLVPSRYFSVRAQYIRVTTRKTFWCLTLVEKELGDEVELRVESRERASRSL